MKKYCYKCTNCGFSSYIAKFFRIVAINDREVEVCSSRTCRIEMPGGAPANW